MSIGKSEDQPLKQINYLAEIDSEECKHLKKLYEEKKAEHDAASKMLQD